MEDVEGSSAEQPCSRTVSAVPFFFRGYFEAREKKNVQDLSRERVFPVVGNVIVKECDNVLFRHAVLDQELVRMAHVSLVPVVSVAVGTSNEDCLVLRDGRLRRRKRRGRECDRKSRGSKNLHRNYFLFQLEVEGLLFFFLEETFCADS